MAKLYSQEFKEKMVAKLLQPGGPTVRQLSKDIGVSKTALYNWKIACTQIPQEGKTSMNSKDNSNHRRPQNWSAEAKLEAVKKTYGMTAEEVGAFCRQHGIYSTHLEQWQKALIEGLKPSVNKEQRAENIKLKSAIKELNSELKRKDKALAETTALLVLKKKANLIWGEEEDD